MADDERTPAQKGDALERAVREIETAILRSFPGYSESAFKIEGKKIVVVAGVRHEIDIYVTASLGPGYEAVFIFECKNWQEKVGKNEIIVFAEKIKAVNAQRGFVVAKSYTADAMSQANTNARLELLFASEIDPSGLMVPFGFHLLQIEGARIEPTFDVKKLADEPPSGTLPLDLDAASFSIGGLAVDLKKYLGEWTEQAKKERTNRFGSTDAEAGFHELELSVERKFEESDAVLLDGRVVRGIKLRGTVPVQVHKAVVVSAFEVATRGRLVTVQIDAPSTQITATFIEHRTH